MTYYATDNLGQKSDEDSFIVKIDTKAPESYMSVSGIPTKWQKESANITAHCSDATGISDVSGCNRSAKALKVYDTMPNKCSQDYNEYTIVGDSKTIISSHKWACSAAVDNAGNIGFSNVAEIKVDQIAPTVAITTPEDNSGMEYLEMDVFASISDQNDLSGVNDSSVKYVLQNQAKNISKTGSLAYDTHLKKYTASIKNILTDLPVGNYTLSVYANDAAGNSAEDSISLQASPYILVLITPIVTDIPYGTNETAEFNMTLIIRGGTEVRMKLTDLINKEKTHVYDPFDQLNARLTNGSAVYKVMNEYNYTSALGLPVTTATDGTPVGSKGVLNFKMDIKDYMLPGQYHADYWFNVTGM